MLIDYPFRVVKAQPSKYGCPTLSRSRSTRFHRPSCSCMQASETSCTAQNCSYVSEQLFAPITIIVYKCIADDPDTDVYVYIKI